MIALWHWSQKYDGKNNTSAGAGRGVMGRWGSNGREGRIVGSLPKQVFPHQIPGIFIALNYDDYAARVALLLLYET
jgi:hypothetical protein